MTNAKTAAPPRKRRGEYAKSEATRAAILDAALAVFAESGYRAGSLREIAQRVGMSEAGLLHHFKNKSELLMAVLDRRDEHAFDITRFNEVDGIERLRGLVRLAAYNASVPGVVELYCTLSAEATSADHPAHAYFLNRYEWTRREVRASAGRGGIGAFALRGAVTAASPRRGPRWAFSSSTNLKETVCSILFAFT